MSPGPAPKQPTRILVVEDNPADIRLIEEMLKEEEAGTPTKITLAGTLAAGIAAVARGGIDVVLLDLGLPDSKGIETFLELEKQADQLPIIVLSGMSDEAVARQAVQHRAQDYLIKGQVQGRTMMRSIRYAIDRKAAEAALRESAERYRRQSAALAALVEVSRAISQTLDLKTLLSQALDAIVGQQIVPIAERRGGIFVLAGEQLKLAAQSGAPPDGCPGLEHDLQMVECLCGQAAQTGELAAACDAVQSSGSTVTLAHGHVFVPLKSGTQVVGVLYLYLPAAAELADDQRELLAAIANQLAVAIENSLLYEEIKTLSLHDPLTSLANRRLMYFELTKGVARTKRGKQLSAIILDIDNFKRFNDTWGHAAGDRVLVEIAQAVEQQIREMDLAARYGGDEFVILLADLSLADAIKVAERIRAQVAGLKIAFAPQAEPLSATVSLGVAAFAAGLDDGDAFLQQVDALLYQAKARGGNRVVAGPAPA